MGNEPPGCYRRLALCLGAVRADLSVGLAPRAAIALWCVDPRFGSRPCGVHGGSAIAVIHAENPGTTHGSILARQGMKREERNSD